MLQACVIRRTGQSKKAILAFTGLVLGAAMSFFASAFPHRVHSGVGTIFNVVGLTVALSCFLFACRAIRCPACRAKWVWDAMRQHAANRWLYALLGARVCPVCGYPDTLSTRRSDVCANQRRTAANGESQGELELTAFGRIQPLAGRSAGVDPSATAPSRSFKGVKRTFVTPRGPLRRKLGLTRIYALPTVKSKVGAFPP